MSGKADTWEQALLDLLFLNTNAASIGDATGLRGSSTAGSLYLSLHTADPGETGDQDDSEVGYGSYARKAVARSGSGWTRTGSSISPAADQSFVTGSSGSIVTATHFGIGTDSSGAGKLLYSGALSPNIPTGNGITPTIKSTSTVTED